jgi:hypothetical protein
LSYHRRSRELSAPKCKRQCIEHHHRYNTAMSSVLRPILIIAGFGLAVFGAFCLNYTKAWTLDRHMAFAAANNLPPPSRTIFYGGILGVAAGGGVVGYALAATSKARATTQRGAPISKT